LAYSGTAAFTPLVWISTVRKPSSLPRAMKRGSDGCSVGSPPDSTRCDGSRFAMRSICPRMSSASKSGTVRSTKQNAHDMLQWPLMRRSARPLPSVSLSKSETFLKSRFSRVLARLRFQSMETSRGMGARPSSPKASTYAGSMPGHDWLIEQVSHAATRVNSSAGACRRYVTRSKNTVPNRSSAPPAAHGTTPRRVVKPHSIFHRRHSSKTRRAASACSA